MRHVPPAMQLLTALLVASGCGDLDTIDHVQDLRLLGVRAEPPDQAIAVDANQMVTGSPQPVQMTALVADPNGKGRPIDYSFSVCAQLDTGTTAAAGGGGGAFGGGSGSAATPTYRCLPEGLQEFARGTTVAKNGWVEIGGALSANASLLTLALTLDRFHGINGLRLPVQLTLGADNTRIVGTKLVVFTLADAATYVPNKNPVLTGINVAGSAWAADAPFAFTGKRPTEEGWHIEPIFDPSLQVAYQQLSFSRRPLPFTERWLFDFFSTFGGFSPSTAGGQRPVSAEPEPPDSNWLPPAEARGPGTFWFVVRDGRGGENWLIRQGVRQPL